MPRTIGALGKQLKMIVGVGLGGEKGGDKEFLQWGRESHTIMKVTGRRVLQKERKQGFSLKKKGRKKS